MFEFESHLVIIIPKTMRFIEKLLILHMCKRMHVQILHVSLLFHLHFEIVANPNK